jgi:hypothetical protein
VTSLILGDSQNSFQFQCYLPKSLNQMKGLRFMSLLYLFKNKTGEGCSSVEAHEFSMCNKSINTKPYRKNNPFKAAC